MNERLNKLLHIIANLGMDKYRFKLGLMVTTVVNETLAAERERCLDLVKYLSDDPELCNVIPSRITLREYVEGEKE